MRALALTSLVVLGACSSGVAPFAVDLTLSFDDSVSDAALAEVTALDIDVAQESYTDDLALGRRARRVERLVYRPAPGATELGFDVTAVSGSGAILANGQATTTISSSATALEVVLSAPAGGDLGSADGARNVDAAGPGNPSLCPSFTGIACQSCEANDFNGPWYTNDRSGGTLVSSSTMAYRGTAACHATVPTQPADTNGTAQLFIDNLPTSGTVYIRAFYYLSGPPPVYSGLLQFSQDSGSYAGYLVLLNPSGGVYLDDVESRASQPTVQFPTGRWVCVEAAVDVATQGYVHLSIDGEDVPSVNLAGNEVESPAATELFLGLNIASAWDYWFDEVAVDTQPIGCLR